ncbi:hypothetical protein F2P58_09340 [Vibrio fortis]|uniref:Uncharacterized protein n=1 Tax=Vibrio fortis TaxID=212667 RepID=A0A5N3R443_9VIBR|nr:D-alanyl-D-alanine carboxypeptidase family protein [Vibrio fortis]KAB0289274.1 hypothetical protein F2P58_09340 [Vibrio fortis]
MEQSKTSFINDQQFADGDLVLELYRFSNIELSKDHSYNWKLSANNHRFSQLEDKIVKDYDFNYDPLMNTLEPHSRELFYWADREYFEKTGRHIDINEGTTPEGNALRSVRRQAQLWMEWKLFKTPGAAPANLPGCSHHNYGLAVDLKNVDEILQMIMRNNGWSDEIPGEKWHFSCTKSRIYNQVLTKIEELRNGLAGQWALDQQAAYKLSQERRSKEDEFDTRKLHSKKMCLRITKVQYCLMPLS